MKKFLFFATSLILGFAMAACSPNPGPDNKPNVDEADAYPMPDAPANGDVLLILHHVYDGQLVWAGTNNNWTNDENDASHLKNANVFQPYLGGEAFGDGEFKAEDHWVYIQFPYDVTPDEEGNVPTLNGKICNLPADADPEAGVWSGEVKDGWEILMGTVADGGNEDGADKKFDVSENRVIVAKIKALVLEDQGSFIKHAGNEWTFEPMENVSEGVYTYTGTWANSGCNIACMPEDFAAVWYALDDARVTNNLPEGYDGQAKWTFTREEGKLQGGTVVIEAAE